MSNATEKHHAKSAEDIGESGFIGHAKIVAGLTLLSRFGGVIRDALCARVFGAGPLWSAFAFAFLIPNLFRRLFGEGALSAAFLPEYARLTDKDPALARQFATLIVGSTAIILGIVTVIGEVILLLILNNTDLLATLGSAADQSGASEVRRQTITLMMIMLPYMPLVCLVALVGAMLQVHKKFAPTAAAPIILNICMITAAIIVYCNINGSINWPLISSGSQNSGGWAGGMVVALSVTVAGIFQLAWSLFALRAKHPFSWLAGKTTETRSIVHQRVKAMLTQMLPMILGLGVLQLNTFLDGIIASYPVWGSDTIYGIKYPLDQASNSILFFTQRLYQFPLGVFGIAIATAIFPALARTAKNKEALTNTLRRGLRLTLYITVPASMGLILVRTPFASVVLEGNEFDAEAVRRVTLVLMGYAPAVWAYSLNQLLARTFFACEDAKTPMRIALWMVVLNLALNLLLIWPLHEAGLAWSTSICAILQTAWLMHAVKKHTNKPIDTTVKNAILNVLFATILMTVAVFLTLYLIVPAEVSWIQQLGILSVAVAIGATVYLTMTKLLKMDELTWLLKRKS